MLKTPFDFLFIQMSHIVLRKEKKSCNAFMGSYYDILWCYFYGRLYKVNKRCNKTVVGAWDNICQFIDLVEVFHSLIRCTLQQHRCHNVLLITIYRQYMGYNQLSQVFMVYWQTLSTMQVVSTIWGRCLLLNSITYLSLYPDWPGYSLVWPDTVTRKNEPCKNHVTCNMLWYQQITSQNKVI